MKVTHRRAKPAILGAPMRRKSTFTSRRRTGSHRCSPLNEALGICYEKVVFRWMVFRDLDPLAFPGDAKGKIEFAPPGGKQPDGAGLIDGNHFLWDSKHHQTRGLAFFALTRAELAEVRAFRNQSPSIAATPFFFVIVPKEDPTAMYMIPIERLVVPSWLGGQRALGTHLLPGDVMDTLPREWFEEERDRLIEEGRFEAKVFGPARI